MRTLTTTNWIIDADMICAKLESAGIEAFIPDQSVVGIDPLYTAALGGIRVQVQESDLERAREVLGMEHPVVDKGICTCPKCGSEKVHYERISSRLAFLAILLLGFPLLWVKRKWVCDDCGHRWRMDGEECAQ